MQKLITLFVILASTVTGYAQKDAPDWLDPYQREAKYPSDKYLVGLSSELVGKKESLANIYKQLNQMSRNQIIESVHVNVKSETVMNISIVNTESTQLLDQNSVSVSNAELVGLKYENYYHKKKKTAFSFSYVSIPDLIEYNLDIIKKNTAAIDNNVMLANNAITAGNKEKAIDLLFESQQKLKEINQSAVMLMALDQDDKLDFKKIGQMKLDIAQGTDNFFNKGSLNVHQLAAFYAYGLQLQIANTGITICPGIIGYQNSGKASKFSSAFGQRVINKLTDLKSVTVATDACDFTFEGSFSLANDKIVATTSFVDANGKVQATVNNKFPYSAVQFGDLTFLPENFEYIKNLEAITLQPEQPDYIIKKVNLFKRPINVTVDLQGKPMEGIPVKFYITRDEAEEYQTTLVSNKAGQVQLVLNTEQIKTSGELLINALVDVPALLDLPAQNPFVQSTLAANPPKTSQIKLKILAPTVYVTSTEMSLGKPLRINILAPSVKNALLALDYKFLDSPEGADYIIAIEASTRKGQQSGYAKFSYLDATVSMVRTDTGKEIYKNSLTSIKGSGANFELASAKAYEKAKKSIGNDISYQLEYGE